MRLILKGSSILYDFYNDLGVDRLEYSVSKRWIGVSGFLAKKGAISSILMGPLGVFDL